MSSPPSSLSFQLDEQSWKTAQIAAILATRYPVPHGQPANHRSADGNWNSARDDADPQLDNFYLSLLRRAQFLLANADVARGDIHAYQIFNPRRRYTFAEITGKFREASWRRLTTENTVRSLIGKICILIQDSMTEQIRHLLGMAFDLTNSDQCSPAEISRKIAHLEAHPELIHNDDQIPSTFKEQISLAKLLHEIVMPNTTELGPEKKFDAFRLFLYCADHGIMDDKLWGLRSTLKRRYPL